ncbi:unnamed protein product [Adineta steineri]|uniref:Uncharacterized protein n=1 Tax=Adineta steineri TaxID=433720 RepID=A0A815P5S7_9BILA|nr:unnamed protein product [Adineta steineri]CAF3977569.1 unnamed protein product [Adineta steineri]
MARFFQVTMQDRFFDLEHKKSTAPPSKTNPDIGDRTVPDPPGGTNIGQNHLYPHPSGGYTVLPYDQFRRFRDLVRKSAFRDVLSDDDDD